MPEANRDISDRKGAEAEVRVALEQLRGMVEQAVEGIIAIDDRGIIESLNAIGERIFGYASAEVVGQNVSLLIPNPDPGRQGEYLAHFKHADAGNVAGSGRELLGRRKDGSIFPLELSLSEVRLNTQHLFAGIVRDVTTRKDAEESLRHSEMRFRHFVEQAADGFFLFAADGQIVDVNRQACVSLGYSQDELVGMTLPQIDPDLTLEQFRAVVEVLAGGHPVTLDTQHRKKDGALFPVEVRLSPYEVAGETLCMAVVRDVTERKRAEAKLLLLDRAMKAVSQGILITDPNLPDNPILYASPGFERLTGYSAAEVEGRNCRLLQGKDSDPEVIRQIREAVRLGKECVVEILNYRKNGTTFWNQLRVAPVRDGMGKLTHFVGVQTDVTAHRELEHQFRQAQKMEAVGQLAGGVAHDFNNLLTVISGYSELLLPTFAPDDSRRVSVQAIAQAGERAATLTRQLLAFSRQTILEPVILNLNDVVQETRKMLARMIGADIELTAQLGASLRPVRIDPGQLGQVLVNLAVNARDAMPRGGKLTLETSNIDLDDEYAALHPDTHAGRYVMLAVSDTGSGMSKEVQRHLFEPFFTTKEVGKGTGLGLAVVHGVIKQSGGSVEVISAVGVGTTFKIYLPAVEESTRPVDLLPGGAGLSGREMILLVEDEEEVRMLAKMGLQSHGYTVLLAKNASEALRLLNQHGEQIQLLATDVVMPGMSGRELAEHARSRFPLLKVLFMSGYTDDTVVRHGFLQGEARFLQKPYTPISLLRKIRQVLDQP